MKTSIEPTSRIFSAVMFTGYCMDFFKNKKIKYGFGENHDYCINNSFP
jgi:hypothetical protein